MLARPRKATSFPKNLYWSIGLILVLAILWMARSDPEAPPKQLTEPLGKIAIIIDDNGYNEEDCLFLAAIEKPVTISILPNLPFSQQIARCAKDNLKEVMLHLPLEPHILDVSYPQDDMIKTTMPKRMVIEKFNLALADVPFAAGINNHMGSKATEDPELISVLFDQMQMRSLFFVDSLVTDKSVCAALARQNGVPFAQRDIFLDNVNDRTYIEKQFDELSQKARENGQAIGIGHARPLTWAVVREQTERLTQEGFQIVSVKTLIHHGDRQ